MRLIGLETATEACSAALWVDGEIRWRMERQASRRHGELILEQVDQVLAEAGLEAGHLDAVAVGRGPGAFTGVRLGLGVAQGLAFAIGCPVVTVSTLGALAQQAADRGAENILAVLDARMGEVYWSVSTVDAQGLVVPGQERVSAPSDVRMAGAGLRRAALGSGVAVCAAELAALGLERANIDGFALPRATEVVRLGAAALARGEGVSPERAQPVYLRDRVAEPARRALREPGAAP